jgi:mannose-6-phosphate isomerase-like protein (cupin superfamily)
MAKLKSTLVVFNEADLKGGPGVVEGQTMKMLVGSDERPSERLSVALATFKPGTLEKLHWHLIEGVYYVISGRAVMKDIEGKRHNLGPGSVIYAPAGIAGSHDWDIREELKLIGIRATNDPSRLIQFDVDETTKRSTIEFKQLMRWGVAKFKSLY